MTARSPRSPTPLAARPSDQAGALCNVLNAITGSTNKSLRGLLAGNLDQDDSPSKISYNSGAYA